MFLFPSINPNTNKSAWNVYTALNQIHQNSLELLLKNVCVCVKGTISKLAVFCREQSE